jgi:hypothetical protein
LSELYSSQPQLLEQVSILFIIKSFCKQTQQ